MPVQKPFDDMILEKALSGSVVDFPLKLATLFK